MGGGEAHVIKMWEVSWEGVLSKVTLLRKPWRQKDTKALKDAQQLSLFSDGVGPAESPPKAEPPALFWISFIHRKLPAQAAQIPPLPR